MKRSVYHKAGELFGYLHETFGNDLCMRMLYAGVAVFKFEWTFRIGKQIYHRDEFVGSYELEQMQSVKAHAESICRRWKKEHRMVKVNVHICEDNEPKAQTDKSSAETHDHN